MWGAEQAAYKKTAFSVQPFGCQKRRHLRVRTRGFEPPPSQLRTRSLVWRVCQFRHVRSLLGRKVKFRPRGKVSTELPSSSTPLCNLPDRCRVETQGPLPRVIQMPAKTPIPEFSVKGLTRPVMPPTQGFSLSDSLNVVIGKTVTLGLRVLSVRAERGSEL